jgi:hypothetical protein
MKRPKLEDMTQVEEARFRLRQARRAALRVLDKLSAVEMGALPPSSREDYERIRVVAETTAAITGSRSPIISSIPPPRTEERLMRRERRVPSDRSDDSLKAPRRNLLNKPNDGAARFWVCDEHKGLHQRKAVRRGKEIGHVGGGESFSRLPSRWPNARHGRRALEEKRNRHLEDLGDVLQAAGADAVSSLFVFLDLLECQPERICNIGLAHVEHKPPHSHAAADMLVGRIKSSPGHLRFPVVAAIFSGCPGPVLQAPATVLPPRDLPSERAPAPRQWWSANSMRAARWRSSRSVRCNRTRA